jgi:chromosome segregation ATPase
MNKAGMNEDERTTQPTIETILERISELSTRFGGVENRLGSLEDRFTGFENRFERVEKRLDGVDEHLERLASVVIDMRADMRDIRKHLKLPLPQEF